MEPGVIPSACNDLQDGSRQTKIVLGYREMARLAGGTGDRVSKRNKYMLVNKGSWVYLRTMQQSRYKVQDVLFLFLQWRGLNLPSCIEPTTELYASPYSLFVFFPK